MRPDGKTSGLAQHDLPYLILQPYNIETALETIWKGVKFLFMEILVFPHSSQINCSKTYQHIPLQYLREQIIIFHRSVVP